MLLIREIQKISEIKWTDIEYHVQDNSDVSHKDVKLYCDMNQLPALPFFSPNSKCTYWSVLGSFNNWNIIQLSHKSTPFGAFYEIHQVVLDGISDKTASLVKSGEYGDI